MDRLAKQIDRAVISATGNDGAATLERAIDAGASPQDIRTIIDGTVPPFRQRQIATKVMADFRAQYIKPAEPEKKKGWFRR